MRRLRWMLLSFALAAGCATGSGRPPKPPNLVEQLQQSAKKVDFAIAETKRLIQRSRGATYLADMQMRLAELYSERARYAWLMVYEKARARGETSRAIEAPEARLLKNLAIGVYDRLLREMADYPRADEALFLLAHEYRELGDFDQMKKSYERLIEEYPKSKHRIEAYLILGDSEFDKGNLPKAEQYYSQVLGEPESHVHPLARYKLGWVKVNREDCKAAVKLFEKILKDKALPIGSKALISTQKSLNIARESLVDIAYCYPEVYGERTASPYFRGLAQSSSDYMAAMRRVASRFAIKQMYAQAAAALREVLAAAVTGDESLETARKLYDNVVKARNYDHAAIDVERIGRVYEAHYFDHRLADPVRKRLAEEFEVYARDIATKTHARAKEVKSNGALFAGAAAAYGAYLDHFAWSKSKLDMEENRAEALLAADLHHQTGQAYEKLSASLTNRDQLYRARVNAISAYQKALEKGGLTRLDRVNAWASIRNLGRALLSDLPPGTNDPKLVPIKLAIARSYYDSGDYSRSADLFYALARQYPTSSEGQVAAQLALDALRLQEDFEGLVTLGKRMMADRRLPDGLRQEIAGIVGKTEQRQIADITISGENREEQLLSYAKRHKGSGLGEQALYNTLLLARDSGDIEKFYQLGEEFIETYGKSERRNDVMAALAQVATDRADYAQAAQFLEAIYDADPQSDASADRLYAAAQIRAALADNKVTADVRKMMTSKKARDKVDDLLMLIARSGNFGPLQDLLNDANVSGTVADFLRGYFAYQRGDAGEALKYLAAVAREKAEGDAVTAEAAARSRFLVGEIAYDALGAQPQAAGNDIAKLIVEKSEMVAAADKAYAMAIQSRRGAWAVGALARVSDAYAKYAAFIRELKLPEELSEDEKKQFKAALGGKADEAANRAKELRTTCAKRAKEAMVFSDAVRSCLTEQPFPEHIAIFPKVTLKRGTPNAAQAAPLRAQLLKKPKAGEPLLKLMELYMSAGDIGTALLLAERAEEADSRHSELYNLRGIALERSGDPDAAYAAFSKAVQADSSNARAHMNLAAHYAAYGYSEKAKQELKKAGSAPTPTGDITEHPEMSALQRIAGGGK